MELIESYRRLEWPDGWARTPAPARRNLYFRDGYVAGSAIEVMQELLNSVNSLGVRSLKITAACPIATTAIWTNANDPGVSIYFEWGGLNRVIASDQYMTSEQNLHAIWMAVLALSMMLRIGSRQVFDKMLEGLTEGPLQRRRRDQEDRPWWVVLGFDRVPQDRSAAEKAAKQLLLAVHPDRGGSEQLAVEVNLAIADARDHFDRLGRK